MDEFGVYVGRFQPPHLAHIATARQALERVKNLLIIVGSANQARDTKNPWRVPERIAMFSESLTEEERERVTFVSVEDKLYNDNLWVLQVQQLVEKHAAGRKVVLFGHLKDQTSEYLKCFPQWTFAPTDVSKFGPFSWFSATKIRTLMFSLDRLSIKDAVSSQTYDFIDAFMKTDEFKRLHDEHHHILEYKALWAGAPFPPTFNTVDSVAFCKGHVLVVRRKGAPGKGLIALPGGFINQTEKCFDAAVRELKEETGIKLSATDLRTYRKDEHVFDHPNRSLRGRTLTHVYCFDLKLASLPVVKGADDADKAWWMPVNQVQDRKEEFFEDHHHIINYFLHRV